VPANPEPGVVRQSSAVNGMVVELMHSFVSHANDSNASEVFKPCVSSGGNITYEKGRQPKCEWVMELTSQKTSTDGIGDERFVSQEVMAGEKSRLRSELTKSSGSHEGEPPRHRLRSQGGPNDTTQPREQKWLPTKPSARKAIQLLAGRPRFALVSGFHDTQVTCLTWGQFFDLSPEGKHQLVKHLVQARPRSKGVASKGKGKAQGEVLESILSVVALVGKMEPYLAVTNLYTTAKIRIEDGMFETDHVLIDAGSVVNLAPISVLRAIGALPLPTKDLVIHTAASNLVPLDFYTDLKVDVASVVTPLCLFAMP